MFDATLLDSSPERMPVLTARHWLAALLVGGLGAAAGYFILPEFFNPSPKALLVESILVGVAVMFYELMIWYVLADARHLGFGTWKWSVALLVLNVVGFVAYLVYSAAKTGEWKRATLPLANIFQGLVVCVLLLVPLVSTQALPDQQWFLRSIVPPPPAGQRPVTQEHAKPVRHSPATNPAEAPWKIPDRIVHVVDTPEASPIAPPNLVWVPGGVGDGKGTGQIPFGPSWGSNTIPAPPEPGKPAAPTKPVVVGGDVQQAKLIFRPDPIYPQFAIMAHIQGQVELEATIGKDGTIEELKAKSGHPFLVKAAMEAVRRWRYQPTLLNNNPVEVLTEIEVNFRLDE